MDRVRARVARLLEDLLGLDDLVNRRLGGIGLGVHDINARGAEPGNDQIAPFEKGVAGQRRQRGRASVPAKVVELVASVRHRHRVDNLAERHLCCRDFEHSICSGNQRPQQVEDRREFGLALLGFNGGVSRRLIRPCTALSRVAIPERLGSVLTSDAKWKVPSPGRVQPTQVVALPSTGSANTAYRPCE